ncbi:hypothetical protein [Dictyobacter kobayashii]|uniref:hypothetical protein n=1 Tax=Dictyobacter kobayashii TaxID=2014872 RepID=UPI000F83BEE7|nr:hypothetical protein [Dictyobacter kobayashii]
MGLLCSVDRHAVKSIWKRRLDAASSAATGSAVEIDQYQANSFACQAASLIQMNGMALPVQVTRRYNVRD